MAYIISSGEISSGIILENDTMTVLDGGTATQTTVNSKGYFYVSSSGIASSTTVNYYGSMFVSSGGTANSTIVYGKNYSGGYLYVFSGGTANQTIVNSRGYFYVFFKGTVNQTTVNSGGRLFVSSGGTANSTIVNAYFDVSPGGTVNQTTVNSGGSMFVSSGGTANSATVNSGGRLEISSGGTAFDVNWTPFQGKVYVKDGACVTFSDQNSGIFYGLGNELISHVMTLEATKIDSGHEMYVMSGGVAKDITVISAGSLCVCNGGMVTSVFVNSGGHMTVLNGCVSCDIQENGGYIYVANGADVSFVANTFNGLVLFNESATVHSGTTANNTVVNGGSIFVFTGGTANSTTINNGRLYVSSGGMANNTIVNGGDSTYGYFHVSSGGMAANTIVNSRGSLCISSGGSANGIIVNSGGKIVVSYNGTANNTIISSGGSLDVSAAGKITGMMRFESGATVFASAGSIVNFDLTQTSAGVTALLNNFSILLGAPTYTLTVDETLDPRMYCLADKVSFFYSSIAVVNTSGIYLGTLSCGQTATFGGMDYTLNITNESMTVTVTQADIIPPEKPVATADITTPTNGDVLVTAAFSEDSAIKEYSLDGENWGAYVGGVLFSSNRTAYFRGIDAAGNISEVASYTVTNIDRTAPAKPSVSVDVTTPTNQSVSVSATFDADSFTKEYSFDGEEWHPYTKTLLLAKNETVSFRGTDEAGNTSEVASLEVNNIDTVAPTDPTGLMTIVSDQTVVLIWNACTDDHSGIKEYVVRYSLEGQESIAVRTNGTSYVLNNADCGSYSWSVQAIDLAGNESAVTTGDAFVVSGFKPYTVEYSEDNFEHVITFAVTTPSLDAFRMPTGTYLLRVKQDGSSEWMTGDSIVAPESDIEPQLIKSDADGNADVFFAHTVGTWESGYLAQHVGSTADTWGGTKEYATLFGKNKLPDIIEGSTDANILLMTDDENGDALFADDIYTASPGDVAEKQSRIAQIDEIRAGAGADIVDMTSQRFEYTGEGLTIRGGEGNDTIWANKGDNFLFGDAGNDRIVGASGNDVIAGGIGNDRLHGGGGEDVFTFCDNWGSDNVEQLSDGSVTLWFTSGSEANWNAETMTYSDGTNSVKVSGNTAGKVTLKFGDDGSAQFASLANMGAFDAFTSQRIFEESGKGILASL